MFIYVYMHAWMYECIYIIFMSVDSTVLCAYIELMYVCVYIYSLCVYIYILCIFVYRSRCRSRLIIDGFHRSAFLLWVWVVVVVPPECSRRIGEMYEARRCYSCRPADFLLAFYNTRFESCWTYLLISLFNCKSYMQTNILGPCVVLSMQLLPKVFGISESRHQLSGFLSIHIYFYAILYISHYTWVRPPM